MNILDMMNKLTALSTPITESEKETSTTHKGGTVTSDEKGVKHKGKYGNDYQGDPDDDEPKDGKKKKKAVAKPEGEKRGRGRPPKGADKDGNVMKPDFSAFGAKKGVKLPKWDKSKTTKHSLKDWIENLDAALLESDEQQMTATPLPGAVAIKNGQGQQVATATNPAAAAMMTKGDITLTDPTKKLGETEGAGKMTARIFFNRDLDEYTVKFYQDGKHLSKADYFTNDKADARGTADAQCKRANASKVSESKMSELDLDLKDKAFTDADFKKQYGKTRAEMRASLKDKKSDEKSTPVKKTSKIKESILRESHETLAHIINTFKHEVKNFIAGQELDQDLFNALYDYYLNQGEMPYGVAKARDGDPMEWVSERFDSDVQNHEVPVDEAVRPEMIPAAQRKQAGANFPATMGQVNRNDSMSHLPNLQANHAAEKADPFGARPIASPIQFEGWDKQLNDLLNEGLNVVANTGLGDAPDSVSISATEEDAQQLLQLVKSAGLGMFADPEQEPTSTAMSTVPGEETPSDIEVVDDSDDMLSMLRKMSGQPAATAPAQDSEEAEEVAEEDEGYDRESNEEYDDGYTRDSFERAEEDSGEEPEEEEEVNESTCEACEAGSCEEHENLDESYANSADDTFETDIDFMQNVISGGLNGRKRNQSVGAKMTVIDDETAPLKESTDLLKDWRILAGFKQAE